MSSFLKLVAILAAGYGALLVALYLLQDRMLYLPSVAGHALTPTPADAGMAYEDVTIRTEDGLSLHGWFVAGQGPRVLLFFHGNAGNIAHRLQSIAQFRRLGLQVLIVDYRGYGRSEGRPSEHGLYADAHAAWRYLTEDRGVPPEQIVIFGRSLGASVAAELASSQRPLALIAESAFTSVPDVASELYPWLPARWLSRLEHATRDDVREVECPVLVVHSRDDEIIPFHHGEAIFAAAREPRSLLVLRGTHNDAYVTDERTYLAGLQTFLAGLPAPD